MAMVEDTTSKAEMAVRRLTDAQRHLLWEMAKDRRVILVQRHPRQWCGLRYSLNSFPIRTLQGTMVATLAKKGYLTLGKRGYYVLTTKAQLEASLKERRSRK
jgi:hypothetical protein